MLNGDQHMKRATESQMGKSVLLWSHLKTLKSTIHTIPHDLMNSQRGTISIMCAIPAFASFNQKRWYWAGDDIIIPFIGLLGFIQVLQEFCAGRDHAGPDSVSSMGNAAFVKYILWLRDDQLMESNFYTHFHNPVDDAHY